MSKPRVYYRVGSGWCYTLKGQERTGFESAEKAAFEMRRESYTLRSIARAEEGRPMTYEDERIEEGSWPNGFSRIGSN